MGRLLRESREGPRSSNRASVIKLTYSSLPGFAIDGVGFLDHHRRAISISKDRVVEDMLLNTESCLQKVRSQVAEASRPPDYSTSSLMTVLGASVPRSKQVDNKRAQILDFRLD